MSIQTRGVAEFGGKKYFGDITTVNAGFEAAVQCEKTDYLVVGKIGQRATISLPAASTSFQDAEECPLDAINTDHWPELPAEEAPAE